jgi:hypothetical protein
MFMLNFCLSAVLQPVQEKINTIQAKKHCSRVGLVNINRTFSLIIAKVWKISHFVTQEFNEKQIIKVNYRGWGLKLNYLQEFIHNVDKKNVIDLKLDYNCYCVKTRFKEFTIDEK